MKGLVVRTCVLIDFLCAIPVFVLLIFVSPERYADTMAASGRTIRTQISKYRADKRMVL